MAHCQNDEVKEDRFFERFDDLSFKTELCIGGDTLFLFSGVSHMTKSSECCVRCTKENVAITLGGKHLPRKYFDTDIIGLPLTAMLWVMPKDVINARDTLGSLEPRLLK